MTMYTHRIRYSETDRHGKLSMQGLLRLFQDLNYLEIEDHGRGLDYQFSQGAAWYLLLWDAHMIRAPRLSETVSFSCFFYHAAGGYAKKYMSLVDEEGRLLAYALTRWAYVDILSGTPAVCPVDYFSEVCHDSLPQDIHPAPRIVVNDGIALPPMAVTERLIDENGHVNNVLFSELALSLMGHDSDAATLQAEFIRQTHAHDILYPRLEHNDSYAAIAFCDQDGKPFAKFRCMTQTSE